MLINNYAQNEDIMELIYNAYREFIEQTVDYAYLQERAILAPINKYVDKINDIMLNKLSREKKNYLSTDTIANIQDNEHDALYTSEFLNTLKFSGISNHSLNLTVGMSIILLRNLNNSIGLCNGI